MEGLLRDLRYGLRIMLKAPGFTILAVVALALGIGSVTSMFSVINGAVLRGLPFPAPEQLVTVQRLDEERQEWNSEIPYLDFKEIQAEQQSFTALAGYYGGTINVVAEGNPVRYTGSRISANFLDILGVQPILGRGFLPEEDTEGGPMAVILGYSAWQNQFGGDPTIIGQEARVNGSVSTIVGVMGQGFAFPINDDIWVPLGTSQTWSEQGRGSWNLSVFGRMKDGVTREGAEAEMAGLINQLADAYPEFNDDFRYARVRPFIERQLGEQTISMLGVMFGMAAFVLIIACANVANLLLARSTVRTKELAIRSSVGASRLRIITQLLTESILLSSLGAVLGVVLAILGNRFLLLYRAELDMPFWFDFPIDASVVALIVAVTILSGVVSGIIPAIRASRANINHLLKDDTRTGTSLGMKIFARGLVITQVTVSCVALIMTVLMARSVANIGNVEMNFDTEQAMTARMGLFDADYPEAAQRLQFFNSLRRNLENRSEIATATTYRRYRWELTGIDWGRWEVEGVAYAEIEDKPLGTAEAVGQNYLATMGIDLLAGRAFDAVDFEEDAAPVVIINRALADVLAPNGNALGLRIRRGPWPGELERMEDPDTFYDDYPWATVVGVVPDMRAQGVTNTTGAEGRHFFFPMRGGAATFNTIAVAPAPGVATGSLIPLIREEVARLDPTIPLYAIGTVGDILREDNVQNRIISNIFKFFGALAAILASIGIYGVMSFAVSQRTQEFGIRAALGAVPSRIRNLVMGSGIWQLVAGLVIGLVAAFFASQLIENFMFGLSADDPLTYGSVALLFSLVALLACAFPAARASRVHPARALRYE